MEGEGTRASRRWTAYEVVVRIIEYSAAFAFPLARSRMHGRTL